MTNGSSFSALCARDRAHRNHDDAREWDDRDNHAQRTLSRRTFEIDIPVAQGSGRPVVGAAGAPPVYIHGHNGLGDIPLPESVAKKTDSRPAHRFTIDTVRAHAQEVAIVAVDPMTNLALALREDPHDFHSRRPLQGQGLSPSGAATQRSRPSSERPSFANCFLIVSTPLISSNSKTAR